MEYNVKKGDFSPLGAVKGKGFTNFCIECRPETDCVVLLYPRGGKGEKVQILVPEEYSRGNLRAWKSMIIILR